MRADGTESDPLVESASKWLIDPTWSPDGTKIAFSQGTGNTWGIWVINVDSRRLYKVAEENNTRMLRPDWSPDGTKIVFERHVGLGRGQVWVINADGTGAAQRWAGGHGFDDFYDSAWSPNGKVIAFHGNPDGAVGGIISFRSSDCSHFYPD